MVRRIVLSISATLASLVLLAVLLAACGQASNHLTQSPTPTATLPSETSAPPPECPNPEGGSCLGPLAPGTYTTSRFIPTLTYVVPADWGNFEDLSGNFLLIPPGGDVSGVDPGTSDYVGVYTSIKPETPDCGPASDVGGSPADIASYFAGHSELQTTKPSQVSIGGLDGVVVDLTLKKGSHKHLVCLIVGAPPSGLEHGVGQGLTMRLYLLAQHDPLFPGTLAIEIDDVSGGGHLEDYSAVVKNFRFAT
jgi:hypothetical protein